MSQCFSRAARPLFAVLGLTLALVSVCTIQPARAAEDGFQSLFDGKTLAGWEGDKNFWSLEDGVITGETTKERPAKHNTFLIWRNGTVDDFEIRFEYRFTGEWGNSGLQYRSWEAPDFVVRGYQADLEVGKSFSGILYGEGFRGILAQRGTETVIGDDHKPRTVGTLGDSAAIQAQIKAGDWNSYRVVAQGFKFTHEINGQVTAVCTDEDHAQRRRSGILAFQVHAGPPMKVQFRNIRLKRLPLKDVKKVVFVAGRPSHAYAAHEHNAGCLLLAKLLEANVPGLLTAVYKSGWPEDPTALDNADVLVIFSDGGPRHPVLPKLAEVDQLVRKGLGVACLHYAVEVPKGPEGDALLRWIGGYYETFWSVNPHYVAQFTSFPKHPVARGLKPFAIDDEWYYHMRFPADMQGVTPILTAIPPDKAHDGRDDAHAGNPEVRKRKGQPEHLAWVCERPDGGRGFGFTGGHHHWNWANPNFRTTVLNAIVWLAKLEVPAGGVPSKTPTLEELLADQDKAQPKKFDREALQKQLERIQAGVAE